MADAIYLTIINREFQGDTFFPDLDLNNWSEVEREDINETRRSLSVTAF